MEIKDKVLLITGGTGSFGTAVLNRFLATDHFKEIRIFSRDEKKPRTSLGEGEVRGPSPERLERFQRSANT